MCVGGLCCSADHEFSTTTVKCGRVPLKLTHMFWTDVYEDLHCQLEKLELSSSSSEKIIISETCIGSLLAIPRELARSWPSTVMGMGLAMFITRVL